MKVMLLSVIELRASDWGREPDEPPGGTTQPANTNTLSYSSQVSNSCLLKMHASFAKLLDFNVVITY